MGLPALALLGAPDPARAARLTAARGAEIGSTEVRGTGTASAGYGRIVLTFDKPVAVKATVSGAVLLIGYGERVAAGPERLAEEMPATLAGVRRDPDGTGLRLALQRPVRANVQAAGERVFIDLLPEGWSGLPPPLPPEVVAELARRAQVAEEALRARAPAPVRRPLALDLARLPTLTRLTLRLPDDAVAAAAQEGPATRLRVSGAWSIDAAEARGRPRLGVARLAVEADAGSASLLVTPAEGYVVRAEREDGAFVLDVARKAPPPPTATAVEVPGPVTAGIKSSGPKSSEIKPPGTGPSGTGPSEAGAPAEASPAPVPRKAAGSGEAAGRDAGPAPARRAGAGLLFRFRALPPAALFERGGVAVLAFETPDPVPAPVAAPSGGQGLRPLGEPLRAGPLAALRFAVPPGRLVDLVAVATADGPAWELTAGDAPGAGSILDPVRRADPAGRVAVSVALPRPGAAAWLDLDGERVAVVPSAGARPAVNPKGRRFVDFEILPSRRGLAVLAGADDLAVRPELDAVTIGREGGLAATSSAASPAQPPEGRPPGAAQAEPDVLSVERGPWERSRAGAARDGLRALALAAAATPPAERGPARLALARAQIANGLDPEGLATLEAAAADDPLLAAGRDAAILRGLALVRLGRVEAARRALSAPRLADDPEAALWRAMAAAVAGEWKAAETGFLRTLPLAARYPADLADEIRASAAEAAIETGDAETAAARAADAPGLPPWPRGRLALVRARVAEATGQVEAALDAYARLGEAGERPVAAEAALRGALLARAAGKLTPEAAIERLERLGLTWHGGPVEDGITPGLARLHLAAGRWREAFSLVRRANAFAPEAAATRALTAEAQAAFEALYLGGDGGARPGASLSGVEAVALYFDFRELAPIGRRGDEVVRRLADRLVGLDLLDSAAELLQHQVDKRLTGPARAAVAARLAAVRLMDGQPMRAVEALDATDFAELPGDLRRARALIRARALSDLTRTDLALETLEGEAGPDIERLRADIYWGARRWREAGEAHEALLGPAWQAGAPLDAAARADAVRAAIAYDLAGEAIGLERLRAKFSEAMARGPDARTFALLTGTDPTRAPGFRAIAARATKADTLAAFLAEYRKRYPEAAVPDRGGAGDAGPEGAGPGRRTSADPAGTPPG